MGRFDRINDDDLMEPGPPVPPMESKPTGRPILMMPPAQRVPTTHPESLLTSDEDPVGDPFANYLPADPREWLFAVVGGEDIGDLIIVFTPIVYWREFVAQIDEHVTEALRASLPPYLLDKEDTESTFLLSGAVDNRDRQPSEVVEADLRARGFQEDQSFTNMVYGR